MASSSKQSQGKIMKVEKVPVIESQIQIKKMCSKSHEGWRILLNNKSCGYVKFHPKIDDIFHQHVTVDFAIPKPKRGLHIGRFGLKLAIASSIHEIFVAHLRKGNFASKKALTAVGFLATKYPGSNQLCMTYKKKA